MSQYVKGQEKPTGSGRRKGTPNKLQQQVRDEMAQFILRTMPKMEAWMDRMDKYSYDDSMAAFTKLLSIALPRVTLSDDGTHEEVNDASEEALQEAVEPDGVL
jgi:hypothetical protein